MLKNLLDPITGILLAATTGLVICKEWGVGNAIVQVLPLLVVSVLVIFLFQVHLSGKIFIIVGATLSAILILSTPEPTDGLITGLSTAAFIAAFFSALSILRIVAETSPSIQKAGAFLATQKPGRRYAALTLGGQLFALVLNYGAIQLLGTLAMGSANSDPNKQIRNVRIKRMLLAIQRGFVSTLTWSPLSFSVLISTSAVPGASWSAIILPGIISSVILAGVGWCLDTIFKPRLTVRPTPHQLVGGWKLMLPLLFLLFLLVTAVAGLYLISGVRIVGLVSLVVPIIAVFWLLIQHRLEAPLSATATRLKSYLFTDLPGYRGELTLLMMAGYIGSVGSILLVPLIQQTGLNTSAMAPVLILVSLVWIVPLAGQLGMNPILAVTLLSPLIPSAESLGVSPNAIVLAVTSGWALSGATSPFTATTLLIGSFAKTSAVRIGVVWNGIYSIICALILSLWVVCFAFLL